MPMLGDQQMEEDKSEVNNGPAAFGSHGENIIGNDADQPGFE